MDNKTPPPAVGTAPLRRRKRTVVLTVVLLALAAWFVHFGWHAYRYEETEDAFLTGHLDRIAPRVSGHVAAVLVRDNQEVRAGDALVRLDPLAYEIAVDRARAALTQAQASATQAEAAVHEIEADVATAAAKLRAAGAAQTQAEAQAGLARLTRERVAQLFRNGGAVTQADVDNAEAALTAGTAAVAAAQANVEAARAAQSADEANLAVERAKVVVARAAVDAAAGALREAERQLAHTVVTAPAAGRVGNRNVETGNYVQPGQLLCNLVEPELWVVANFKETQLGRMQPGMPVAIAVDALPGLELQGRIESLAPASGAQFSLLPPDNATGNFTKVVQRVPVKIVLEPESLAAVATRLRAGLSVVATVRVR